MHPGEFPVTHSRMKGGGSSIHRQQQQCSMTTAVCTRKTGKLKVGSTYWPSASIWVILGVFTMCVGGWGVGVFPYTAMP